MPLSCFQTARGRASLFLCLVIGVASIAPAQSAKYESTDIAVLRAEVRRLASEFLQHRTEFIEWKMHWMSSELQQVRAERQRLSSERQLIEREIGELNPGSPNGAGAEDEARKQELNTIQRPALLDSERAAAVQEARLVSALTAEGARMADIRKELQRLATQTSTYK